MKSPVLLAMETLNSSFSPGVPLAHLCVFGSAIYAVGTYGLVSNRHSIIEMLISAELCTLGLCLNFVFVGLYLGHPLGQVMALLALSVGAAEAACGLALAVLWYRLVGSSSLVRDDRLMN
jgi:NADH:ubiquinone oxidoreductase subunit K